jgi:multidrug resistance efflux pump
VDQGDWVSGGQRIAALSAPDLEAAYHRAVWGREADSAAAQAVFLGPTLQERNTENTRVSVGWQELEKARQRYQRTFSAFQAGLVSSEDLARDETSMGREVSRYEYLLSSQDRKLAGSSGEEREVERQKVRRQAVEVGRLARVVAGLEVRAPESGWVITDRPKDLLGKHFSKGAEVLRLGSKDVVLEMLVPEEESVDLKEGASVRFMPRSGDGLVRGRVRFVAPHTDVPRLHVSNLLAFPPTRSVRVVADLDEKIPELQRIGITGKAKIAAGRHPLGYLLFRKLWRLLKMTFWASL